MVNIWQTDGDIARSVVGSGDTVVIDVADMPAVLPYHWYSVKPKRQRSYIAGTAGDPPHMMTLPRFLLGGAPGSHIRHRNGDYADCRRSNLIDPAFDYRIEGDIAYLPVTGSGSTRGQMLEAMIDAEDLDLVQSVGRRWQILPTGYVYANKRVNGKREVVYLHRLITSCPDGMTVDHDRHNKLDNRRAKLKVVPQQQNSENRQGADRDSKSGIRGVYFNGRWNAQITVRHRVYTRSFLGTPEGLEQAKAAVVELRRLHMRNSQEPTA